MEDERLTDESLAAFFSDGEKNWVQQCMKAICHDLEDATDEEMLQLRDSAKRFLAGDKDVALETPLIWFGANMTLIWQSGYEAAARKYKEGKDVRNT
ncbi:MAG: hypothetical protein C4534_08150 [Gaiellales bacterium]|nr:MAG: hypothetical protein C4534_08150 [Gaiellales bacterium]